MGRIAHLVADLARQHHLIAAPFERAAGDLLGRAPVVDIGRIEEVDAAFQAAADHAPRRGLIGLGAERHGAEADARNREVRPRELSCLHRPSVAGQPRLRGKRRPAPALAARTRALQLVAFHGPLPLHLLFAFLGGLHGGEGELVAFDLAVLDGERTAAAPRRRVHGSRQLAALGLEIERHLDRLRFAALLSGLHLHLSHPLAIDAGGRGQASENQHQKGNAFSHNRIEHHRGRKVTA